MFRYLDARDVHLSVVRVCRRWTMLAASVTEVFSADIERGNFAMLRIPNDRVYDVQWNQWPNAGMPEPRCSSCTATTPWRGMLPKMPTLLAWAARSARTGDKLWDKLCFDLIATRDSTGQPPVQAAARHPEAAASVRER